MITRSFSSPLLPLLLAISCLPPGPAARPASAQAVPTKQENTVKQENAAKQENATQPEATRQDDEQQRLDRAAIPPMLQQALEAALKAFQRGDLEAAGKANGELIDRCQRAIEVTAVKRHAAETELIYSALQMSIQLDTRLGNRDRVDQTLAQFQPLGPKSQVLGRATVLAERRHAQGRESVDDIDQAISLVILANSLPPREPARWIGQIEGMITILQQTQSRTNDQSLLDRLEQRLVDGGVPLVVARLVRFAEAEQAIAAGEMVRLARVLDDLQWVVSDPGHVATYFDALLANKQATLAIHHGEYYRALDACRRFRDLIPRTLGPYQCALSAIASDQLGLITLKLGDYPEAERLLRKSQSIRVKCGQPASPQVAAEWKVNLATALSGQALSGRALSGDGQIQDAIDLLEQARQDLSAEGPDLSASESTLAPLKATVENNLSLLHYARGEFRDANRLLATRLDAPRGDPVRRGEALINAGWVAIGMQEVDEAREHFAAANDLFRIHLGEDHPRYAEALACQARAAVLAGDRETARDLIEQAERLDFARVCRQASGARSIRDQIAIIQEARVHPESPVWPGVYDTYLELASEVGIPPQQQYEVVLRWKGLLSKIDQHVSAHGKNVRAHGKNVRAHGKNGGSGSQDSASGRQKPGAGEITEQERFLQQELRQEFANSELSAQAKKTRIETMEAELRELRRQRSDSRRLNPQAATVTFAEVTAGLERGDALIDIVQQRLFVSPETFVSSDTGSSLRSQEYCVFVTHREDGQWKVDRTTFGDTAAVDTAIDRWTRLIVSANRNNRGITLVRRTPKLTLKEAAAAVSRLVQRSIVQTAPDARRLLIRADGATHLVPWAALPAVSGEPARYWIEEVSIRIADAVPINRHDADRSAGSLLAVGGIDFRGFRTNLKGTRREQQMVIERFQSRYPEQKPAALGGLEATKPTILAAMTGKGVIHLATHGEFDPGKPDEQSDRGGQNAAFDLSGEVSLLRSFLICSPGRGKPGILAPRQRQNAADSLLTAAEIRELDLRDASLVVLSACESGLGTVQAGQGVRGLLGSIHAAGAEHVVATLWVVDDEATVTLMQMFYKNLWDRGLPPAEALRAAQLEMIRQRDPDGELESLAHPYAWAAFFCSG